MACPLLTASTGGKRTQRVRTQDARIDALCEALTEYLDAHAHAADTVEGIARWWLPDDLARDSRPEDLACAVERLTRRGRLHPVASPDGRTLYLNQDPHRLH